MKTRIQALASLTFVYFLAIAATMQAVVPPPDGGYPNFTTAEGTKALQNLTIGAANTGVGWYALFSVTTAGFNTALGAGTLALNTADSNTAVGTAALLLNTIGTDNTATGVAALGFNDIGSENTTNGAFALSSNTTGDFNTAIGSLAATFNETGFQNTAIGFGAANGNETGFGNTAVGYQALLNNDGGSGNTALGYLAGSNLTIGDSNICIGNDGVAGDAGVIRIGRNFINSTYIAGISGQTASGGAAVYVATDGKLGTNTSSARFKDEIRPMGEASEAILALQPVSFRYKKEIDPQRVPQFGLVAEEVDKVNPDLVIRDQQDKPHTVRYEQINAMLLNEFLKEHRRGEEQDCKIQEQQTTIAELKSEIMSLAAMVNEQKSQLQKVSAQIDMNKSEPQFAQIP